MEITWQVEDGYVTGSRKKTEAELVAGILEHGPDNLVVPKKYMIPIDGELCWDIPTRLLITRSEQLRRFKVARKAWAARNAKQQQLPL